MTEEVSTPLRELWRRRAQLLASNVATRSREHREISHAAVLISKDYHNRFLIELIQNANDQAIRGNTMDSTVLVVRSQHFLAISNGGQVVTARNLERISSLADSDKTGLLVGNKGVGFKAVYQVTDMPEVYSAVEQDVVGGRASVSDGLGVGFALERRPFDDAALVEAVEEDIRSFFRANAGLADALAKQGYEDPIAAVRPEYQTVAGFKFPRPRTMSHLKNRLEELRIPAELLSGVRTLVILPLRNEVACEDTEKAITQLVDAANGDCAQGELAVLFLAGVGELVVVDHVRGKRWSFTCKVVPGENGLDHATVIRRENDGASGQAQYWLMRTDAFDCDGFRAAQRRQIVDKALTEFGLEAWQPDDPLPVTVALPKPSGDGTARLGSPGRFCLGLPTDQLTGLPAHVDGRFFATINRGGVNFDRQGYNAMLLDVATDLFGKLLERLRASKILADRRAATLALHRPKAAGALARRVYEAGGIADGDVVLAWGGTVFVRRKDCKLPSDKERELLLSLGEALSVTPELLLQLPEEELITKASDVLDTLGLAKVALSSSHPWLERCSGGNSAVEYAARINRTAGPDWWEPFVKALDAQFTASQLRNQSWLPVGENDLAAPVQHVFLPALVGIQGDDEEMADVPPRVAPKLRLLDGNAIRLRRDDGRALTPLAFTLADAKHVRRPRKLELLEEFLFPALEEAARDDPEFALDLFGQVVGWVASMRETSRKKLDCRRALVPVVTPVGLRWRQAGQAYLGCDWGLNKEHESLLARAYPDARLVAFSELSRHIGVAADDVKSGREAVMVLGVLDCPRIDVIHRDPSPLISYQETLRIKGNPRLENSLLQFIYSNYLDHLTTYKTRWKEKLPHDVDDVKWVDGLEDPSRRQYVLDLILAHPDSYLKHTMTSLHRVGNYTQSQQVPQLWAFALSNLGWPIFLAEQGAGGKNVRLPASQVWLLTTGSRRSAYARLLDVVPHILTQASKLLEAVGVSSIDDAPLAQLLTGLTLLANRLETDHLHTSRDALSLARELFTQVEDRLNGSEMPVWLAGKVLPLLQDGRLLAVGPSNGSAQVVFDDDPARSRHVAGIECAYRVPVEHGAKSDNLYALFVAMWGASRVVRTSTAEVELDFTPRDESPQRFIDWLARTFPHIEVAVELAAILTHGGDRTLRSDELNRNWKNFEKLYIEVGSFRSSEIRSFYDRPLNILRVSASLDPENLVAATWEVAGTRSRDLWEGYSRALRETIERPSATRDFLRERRITEVEIVGVADAAGLHRDNSVGALECALIAARRHLIPGIDLDAAAAWWTEVEHTPEAVASSLLRPDLAPVIAEAGLMRHPDGDLHLLRYLDVHWSAWQNAVLRRDGQKYRFEKSVARFSHVLKHLLAVVRELAIRDSKIDLDQLAYLLDIVVKQETPEDVATAPLDATESDRAVRRAIELALDSYPSLTMALNTLPNPPWDILPIPKEATQRGVALLLTAPASARETEASTTIRAIVDVSALLAPTLSERIDAQAILSNSRLIKLTRGAWAHVYGALFLLRDLMHGIAPETTKRMSAIRAFHTATTEDVLKAALPELRRIVTPKPVPRKKVLGVELTDSDLTQDLAEGTNGTLGAKLAEAASRGLHPTLLNVTRTPLPPTHRNSNSLGGGGGRGAGSVKPAHEQELVGDLGEAFVHEWLSITLGENYGPECWRSKARERYGLPACGQDSLGYDFDVADPEGRLFNCRSEHLLIEVKSTSTDGSGPFPMSRHEWDVARDCHEARNSGVYVIVRVFGADTAPRVGDVLVDPFAAYQRQEVRLTERDLWVTVAAPQPSAGPAGASDKGSG